MNDTPFETLKKPEVIYEDQDEDSCILITKVGLQFAISMQDKYFSVDYEKGGATASISKDINLAEIRKISRALSKALKEIDNVLL